MKEINVIGAGYIGLPTSLILAANGLNVVCTDCKPDIIAQLNKGILPFKEKGLSELFQKAQTNLISFQTEYRKTDLYIVAVPTPYNKKSKKIDPQYIINAVESIIRVCSYQTIIVIESTVSPGTIDQFIRPIIESAGLRIGVDIHLAHAPERIIPGNMIYELENNARIIGTDSAEVGEQVKKIYTSFCTGEIILTDIKSAEMSKVVENTYRDINIAFANELTKICNTAKMNIHEIIRLANMHPRVNILNPGPGVGGHCIAVDPWFLVGDYPGLANIILTARNINDSMPEYVLKRVTEIMEENALKDVSKIGFYGLTYKEDVSDVRESPTLQLLEKMKQHLAPLPKVYDPLIKEKIVENQYFDFNKFINDIEILVVMVGHEHLKHNIQDLNNKVVFDTKNAINLPNKYSL